MTTILSTKILSLSQKEHLLNAGLAVVDFDFIATKEIKFKSPSVVENAIVTSQNGAKAILKQNIQINNAFCVGKRTEKLIKENNITIRYTANNAEALSKFIIETEKINNKTFHYFCAKDRLDTLPHQLTQHHIQWNEIPVYQTLYTPKKYTQTFNGVLFFSPSAVQSFFSCNIKPEHSFCIGNTTAKTLKLYTQNFTVASQPSIENVLIKVIKHYKK